MARKSPLGKIKDAAVETIKDPIGTGQKAAGQAVGQALGTIGTVTSTVGAVTSKVTGRNRSSAKAEERPKPVAVPDTPSRPHGDPVSPTKTEDRALREDSSPKLASVPTKAPAKKATSKQAPAPSAPAKKAPAKTTTAKQAPAKKAAKAVPTPADVAKKTAAKKTAAKTTAAKAPATSTPAPAKKTSAKKATATKAPGKKAPRKKAPAKKRPLTAAELVAGAGTEVITPVGTRGADVAHNPNTNITDLQQPGTAPLMDKGTVKAISKEAEMLRRAADPNKG